MPSFRGSREMAKSQRGPVALAARWCENGVWERMLEHFADDPDMENGMVDSTVVRAHASAAGATKKRRGSATTSSRRMI